jgi:hypothetical protein
VVGVLSRWASPARRAGDSRCLVLHHSSICKLRRIPPYLYLCCPATYPGRRPRREPRMA